MREMEKGTWVALMASTRPKWLSVMPRRRRMPYREIRRLITGIIWEKEKVASSSTFQRK